MIVNIDNCGIGLNSDLTPEELGNGVWSDVENMRFRNGYAERFRGTAQVFTAPSVTPYFLQPYSTSTARFWIHCGLASIFADDGTTRANITNGLRTGAVDDRWTGGALNGVLVLNNGKDIPQFWGGTGTLANLPSWNAVWKAQSIRPFKNFLIALNFSKGAVNLPHMVKWSHIAEPGAIPTSWDEANPALDAGEVDLAETPDVLVDCLPLGDVNIIYKERSMYAMSYVGAPFIFRFQRLPGESGMLARGCAANTPLGHVVLTAGDVVLNTGQGVQSIANGAVRDYIFRNIDSVTFKRAFVTANPQRSEVWICFPYGQSETCNRACVWSWETKAWGIRSLNNATYGAFGQINASGGSSTWADSDTWETDGSSWNENEYSPAEARLLLTHTIPLITLQDTGVTDLGGLISAKLERTGIHLGSPDTVKTMSEIFPQIDAAAGSVVNVQFGASMFADSAPQWGPVQSFEVGQTNKVNSFMSGRFLAVRFLNADFAPWRIKSFRIRYEPAGIY